ncbi:Nitrogen regulation protein NtrY [hydrothermal vent metagenome]|uniref:histidine kinase n=1 Tax=hydrothermal vent metagenome TaxID=652676 RepID=A0A3B0ZYZ0_9ZZZZ
MKQLAKQFFNRLFSGSAPIISLVVLLTASLYLMSGATHNSAQFSQQFSVLLGINALATILLVGLITKNLITLIKQYRRRKVGSRLTAKLVIMFVILSVTPVSVVYYFSLDFLQRGIDSWFDVRVEKALSDSLELSKASLEERMNDLVADVQQQATELVNTTDELVALKLNELRLDSNASELTLFHYSGHIIGSSAADTKQLIPLGLKEKTVTKSRKGESDFSLIPFTDQNTDINKGSIRIRIAVPVASPDPVAEGRVLQALYPVTPRMNSLAATVQTAFSDYNELTYLRNPLKYSFILTLSLVLMLSILSAIWAAFFYARHLVAPVTNLVKGTLAVAKGDYTIRLPLPGNDDLGNLVRSFNDMMHQLTMARESAELSQQQLESSHSYLQGVLANLTSGVLTLDTHHNLITSNITASQILGIDLTGYIDKELEIIVDDHTFLYLFLDAIKPHLTNSDKQWTEEITLFAKEGRQVIMCRGTTLPEGGFVIVFDDITQSLQSQRNAAWGEVARRLAHEIKNPLTPIQLSAERLRHKYLNTMPVEDAEVLDRSTNTIVQQVETLKQMVKAFSDYARMPAVELKTIDLNSLINEVLDLYQNTEANVQINTQLDNTMPHIEADINRMRQLLTNLVKNALEAMEEQAEGELIITTECAKKAACHYVELRIKDTGPGIPHDMFSTLFEPYITSKPKGSGLGLAIVKKIVEEHGGVLWAENNQSPLNTQPLDTTRIQTGATIFIRLPVVSIKNKISIDTSATSLDLLNKGSNNAAA